ncbi:MAG TPA: tRNA-dihydrouridine synthase, partial [Candidatus Paceibacterota bacterium]|nr:tRNA-dihydrouridine synthase [Candidatus Paceibacterota bacterium]
REKKKPFFCVAPMADVTDAAFRRMLVKYGKPDVVWTEFVSANGLMSPGREVLQKDLLYTEGERPIVAQLFSSDPEKMEGAARLCAQLGFDGIDINMGCPDKTIEKQGAGAAMIKTPQRALEIIAAAKRGAPNLPISVKTRVGYNSVQIENWIPLLLSADIAALSVHVRTRKELSLVPAHWELMKKVVELRDWLAPQTVIIGNGDVTSLADAREKAKTSGCDGVMIGRALFGNPWFFDEDRGMVAALPKKQPEWIRKTFLRKFFDTKRTAAQSRIAPIAPHERLMMMIEHCRLFEALLGDVKPFAIMKKHFKAYCNGFAGAKELRVKLMETRSASEVREIVDDFLLTKK